MEVERGSEMAEDGPRSPPDEAKMAQHGPEMSPRRPKMAQARPKIGPIEVRGGQKLPQIGPKIGEDEVKMSKMRRNSSLSKIFKNIRTTNMFAGSEARGKAQDEPKMGQDRAKMGQDERRLEVIR